VVERRDDTVGDLSGRVAVVTGAGRGIGAATARKLAADGARVAVVDLNEDLCRETVGAITAAGGEAMAVGCDVSNAEQVERAFERIANEWGRMDILVNNARVTRDNLLFKMSEGDWDTVMNIHLKGSFLCSRAAQKHMVQNKYGKIVNLSSTSALGNRGQANYSAAKAGLQGFTKTLAKELGKFGVTANAVAPGFIATEMTEDLPDSILDVVPAKRVGTPEEVAAAVRFLASDDAGYVTGSTLFVDGGMSA
jgi:3-oxoacyl-[acyl-carrier protein] reductase